MTIINVLIVLLYTWHAGSFDGPVYRRFLSSPLVPLTRPPCSLQLQARVTELETKLVKLEASEQSARERYDVVSSKLKELISRYKVSGAIACLFNLYNSGDLLKKK